MPGFLNQVIGGLPGLCAGTLGVLFGAESGLLRDAGSGLPGLGDRPVRLFLRLSFRLLEDLASPEFSSSNEIAGIRSACLCIAGYLRCFLLCLSNQVGRVLFRAVPCLFDYIRGILFRLRDRPLGIVCGALSRLFDDLVGPRLGLANAFSRLLRALLGLFGKMSSCLLRLGDCTARVLFGLLSCLFDDLFGGLPGL